MLSDEVRARIAKLGTLRPSSTPDLLRVVPTSAPSVPPFLKDGNTCENGSGAHLRFCQPLAAFWPAADQITPDFAKTASQGIYTDEVHPELAAVIAHFPDRTMFLDLETCGFAGSPIFLAGLVWRSGDRLVIDQLFARHYGEERALLETLWSIAAGQRVVATFNGKSFDWPMVRDRSIRHRLPQQPVRSAKQRVPSTGDAMTHFDLLHHARRRWKRVLPDCKLQTLERYVCRRARHDDLPGAQVPAAYQQFVRSGECEPIRSILQHNALDLVTLVQVTLKLIDLQRNAPTKFSEAG